MSNIFLSKNPIIITTINKITEGVKKFAALQDWMCIIIGDKKSPSVDEFEYPNIIYIAYNDQPQLGFNLEAYLPINHYCRKNLGYLFAIKSGAKLIAETDDDNIPYPNWAKAVVDILAINESEVIQSPKLCNVYKVFCDEFVWPRGFPLTSVSDDQELQYGYEKFDKVCVWQGLADIEPDVDAIFRLIFKDKKVYFKKTNKPAILGKGVYCPFNSQNTIWDEKAFVFLYLPVSVDFRFTDILRSYIAQKGIWAMEGRVAFTSSSVYQMRNRHNLMNDFKNEINCYTQIDSLIETLEACELSGNPFKDIKDMYQALIEKRIIQDKELAAIEAWILDLNSILLNN